MSVPMMRWSAYLLLLLLTSLPAACQKAASSKTKSAFDKTTLEAYVRHLFVWSSEIKVEISDPKPSAIPGLSEVIVRASAQGATVEQPFFVSKDGSQILQGTVYNINDSPFRADLAKLGEVTGPSLGTPGAPVVLVLFTDYACPYCGIEARMLRENLLKTFPTQVRLYLKEFPLEQIHPWAKAAALAGRCFYQQSDQAFWQFHDWVFEEQSEITPENFHTKVLEFGKSHGADMLQLVRCIDTKMMEAEVAMSVDLARRLQLNSTPTIFINGRRIAAQLTWEQLRGIIENELSYQKASGTAGDKDCCEVSLPSPLPKK